VDVEVEFFFSGVNLNKFNGCRVTMVKLDGLGEKPNCLQLNNGKFKVKDSNLKSNEQMYMYMV
jgi:hypothetical protein